MRNKRTMQTGATVPAETDRLLYAVDLAGTLIFGIEGAMAAITGNLDLLGLLVLACATAFGGGVLRDLLIGDIPPASMRDWRYAAVAVAGGVCVFFLHRQVEGTPGWLMTVVDAAGLSLFAVAGTEKALQFKMHPFIAALMGTITGVGGGVVRDVLLAQVPRVLRADVYATAALAGAVIMLVARKVRVSPTWAAVLGGTACFLLRMISVWRHWNLPKVGAG
jgi:uncharacterized membrane protein YeiH